MMSEWVIVLIALAQAPAAEPVKAPTAVKPAANAAAPTPAVRAARTLPPVAAQTVPARPAPTTQPASGARFALPRANRVELANRLAGVAPAGQLLNRPPARAFEPLHLSGGDVTYEIIGGKLILTGPTDDLDQLESFINRIRTDIPAPTAKVVQLENSLAEEIAPLVQDVFNQMAGDRARQGDQVIIVPDPRTNSLIVAVSGEERFKLVESLIKELDSISVVPDDSQFEVIDLNHVHPDLAKEMLLQYLNLPSGRGGQASLEERIKIESFPRFDNITVTASPEDIDRVKALLAKYIDIPLKAGSAVIQVRRFPLINTQAADLVPVLEEILEAGQLGAAEASVGARSMREALQEHIRRLRLVTDADTEPIELNLEKPIRLVADDSTNSVWVGSTPENLVAMAEIIKLLDAVPLAPSVQVKVFLLNNADSETVVTLLQDFFDQAKSLSLQPGQRSEELTRATPKGPDGRAYVYPVSIAGDSRTNTIIVSGQAESIAMAQTIITSIDGESARLKHPLRLITLENGSASDLVTTIQQLLDQRDEANSRLGENAQALEKVFVAADVRSNSIIISAKEDNYQEILALIQKLDSAKNLLGDVKIITLKKTQADQIAQQITDLWERRAQMLGGEQAGLRDLPVVVPDLRSNSLVIASSPADFRAIESLIAKLEAQPFAPTAAIRIIKLDNNDASTVGPMLQTLFDQRMQQRLTDGQTEQPSDRVAIEADPGNNLLLIASSLENYTLIEELAKELDAEPILDGQLRVFYLENANAEQMAATVEQLFQEGVITRNPLAATTSLGTEATKVTIVPDTRANAVIVSASPEYMALAEKLIKELDAIGVPRIYDNMKLIKVKFADVIRLKGMLDELFQSSGSGQNVDISTTVLADERTNTLVLWGSRDGVARAIKLVGDLDIDEGIASPIQVYTLNHVSAQKVGPMLDTLFDERRSGGGAAATERTPVTILPEEGSNSLVVSASLEDHETIKELLGRIDKPSNIASNMHFIALEKANAETLADTLQQLLDERLRTQGTGAGSQGGTGISVAAEVRTNSLIVWATESDFQQIRQMVEALDKHKTARNVVMRLFRLHNSVAEDVANMLINHIQAAGTGTTVTSADEGGGGGGGEDDRTMLITLSVQDPITGVRTERTLLRQDITVTPDVKSNTLIVSAPPDSIGMLESLIRTLDEIPPLTASLRIFELLNANAEEMQNMLEQLFQVGEFRPEDDRERLTLTVGESGIALPGGGEGIVTGKDEISFTVDLRTNSVIAAGTEAQLAVVGDMIRRLDSVEIEDRINRVVTIKYGEATLIAEALDQFISDETARLERMGENMAIQRLIEREVTVVPQEETNKLLLSVSPRYESQVMEMIRQLDQPPAMVKIELLIAEVTIDDSLELGLEFALQDLLFSERSTVNANGLVQGSNFDFVGGTDIGASGSGALGGFSFTITGEDFSFLLRTLKTEGRLQVVSRPLLMIQDGKEGNITVGQQVPFVRGVNVLDTGQVQSTIEYEEIGIILDVIPHINPDGFIQLELSAEISQITDSSVTITEGFTAPIFTQRSTQTQITIKDGETVVIGGLISTQEEQRENKVPIVGDLPGIGPLFRATQQSSSRTELLIIITPEIIRTVDDARDMSEEQIVDQTRMIDKHMRDGEMFRRLQKRPGDQLRGVPIDLLDRNGYKNGRGNGSGNGSRGRNGSRPKTIKPADLFAPRPNVYGPPRPVSIETLGPSISAKSNMVGPKHYSQYLKQRH